MPPNYTCYNYASFSTVFAARSMLFRLLSDALQLERIKLSGTCFGCLGRMDNHNFKHLFTGMQTFPLLFPTCTFEVCFFNLSYSFALVDKWFDWSTFLSPGLEYTDHFDCSNELAFPCIHISNGRHVPDLINTFISNSDLDNSLNPIKWPSWNLIHDTSAPKANSWFTGLSYHMFEKDFVLLSLKHANKNDT